MVKIHAKRPPYMPKNDGIFVGKMNIDTLQHLVDAFLEFIFNLYVFIIDILYAIYYWRQKRKYVSTAPNSKFLEQAAIDTQRDIVLHGVSCVDVLEDFIRRIEEVNPIVNAVCFRNYEAARAQAREYDDQLEKMSLEEKRVLFEKQPLFGVPISIKNNIDVAGFPTVNGWFKLKDNVAAKDATAVERLRKAGAIILVMTNVPELCLWIETSNSTFGLTRNAYDSRRTSGGSSGGEAALLSAAATVIGVGTDIAGSIRVPCIFSGLFGLKPSADISPISGLHPVDKASRAYMQTVGPMCRFADDLEPLFKALCDPAQFSKLLPPKDIDKLRVFCFPGFKGWSIERIGTEQRNAYYKVIHHFTEKLKRPVPVVDIPFQDRMYHLAAVSVQDGLDMPYCDLMNGTKDIFEFITDFGKYLLGSKEAKHYKLSRQVNMNSMFMHGHSKHEVEKVVHFRNRASAIMCELLGDNGIIIVPGWPTTAVYHDRTVWKHSGITHTAVWNVLGMPVVAVPLGLSKDGLPLGVQIVASKLNDLTLLRVAQYLDGNSKKGLCPNKFPGYVGPWHLDPSC